MKLQINNTFIEELPADPIKVNTRRQVTEACFSYVNPKTTKAPKLIHYSSEVAKLLGISEEDARSQEFLNVFTGNKLLPKTEPYAMCYAGHQFGQWAGQLGDGRAINLAEVEHSKKCWTIQLKGAGKTPYSRTADGLAVLRSSIREYLCSEAMHHLGIATTRALSIALTGDEVLRDMLYDGNSAYEKGAIVCRVAPSFLRFGSYEIFASRGDKKNLKKVVDYTIKHFYPNIEKGTKEGYVQFFEAVSMLTLNMVIDWQRVGFVHGVMNTDNMSILGLTIDYGPYGWLEGYDKKWTPNTTDLQHKRYQYGNQPDIALWNLLKLANALYPLIEEAEPLENVLNNYKITFTKKHLNMMRSKLGLELELESDVQLVKQLEENLKRTETDMTIFYRSLSNFSKDAVITEKSGKECLELLQTAFYHPNELKGEVLWFWREWLLSYKGRLQLETEDDANRRQKMNTVNPKYVLRNYMAQVAIDAANEGDFSVVDELFTLLKKPYEEQPNAEKWFVKRPEWARTKVGCSMLSCSS